MPLLRVVMFITGLVIVAGTLLSAIQTFVLLALANLTMAPIVPWSSDRVVQYRRTSVLRRSI